MRQRKRRKTMRPESPPKPDGSSTAAVKVHEPLCVNGVCAAQYPRTHPVPSFLNENDKAHHLTCSQGNLCVEYDGPGEEKDAAAIRADASVPPSGIALYYFEAKVLNEGAKGRIGVGLCTKQVNLDKMPGWEQGSYGYHGDDGCAFKTTGESGEKYGPTFGKDDVVGCCWDMVDNAVFFTKNGKMLGTAFRNVSGTLYPTVGMQTKNGRVSVNFGTSPFLFDIESFVREQRDRVLGSTSLLKLQGGDNHVADAVLGYMIHSGFAKTAKALALNADRKCGPGASQNLSCQTALNSAAFAGIEIRQEIIAKIMDGSVAEAEELAFREFPDLTLDDAETSFLLKTQLFIELLVSGKAALDEALRYGRAVLLPLHEVFPERLEEVYSLLAYTDPFSSPVSHLVHSQRRELVADRLNTAILHSQGLPRMSTLERVVAHSDGVLKAHREISNGAVALLRGVDDFR